MKIKKKKRFFATIISLAILIICYNVLYYFNIIPHRVYSAEDFHIEIIHSETDYNNNEIDDYTDILLGARIDAKNKPKYKSVYYAGGYPPENEGVCTDVIWRAFKNAGYSLKDMVNEDIKNNVDKYPRVEGNPDGNIDFRRVPNLKVFFHRNAKSLTLDPYKIEEWQPGDIVIFSPKYNHIGIISDKRNKDGIPFMIHNSGQPIREEDALLKWHRLHGITGHYRFDTSKMAKNEIVGFEENIENDEEDNISMINLEGETIKERFNLPEGFVRVSEEKGSFGEYLRNLPLKPSDSPVLYYDGREKRKEGVYTAVVDMEIGNRDLQQCADAVMRLRAEYLYKNKRYDEIKFHFVNGFLCDYNKWIQGYRVKINGNDTSWVKTAKSSDGYEVFRSYLNMVFAYASTISLEKELTPVDKSKMKIGDVFIKGANPGHAVIVVDMAENKNTGEKLFMIAQSYMPAQETQILTNRNDRNISPWYSINYSEKLYTPEWTFDKNMLRTW